MHLDEKGRLQDPSDAGLAMKLHSAPLVLENSEAEDSFILRLVSRKLGAQGFGGGLAVVLVV